MNPYAILTPTTPTSAIVRTHAAKAQNAMDDLVATRAYRSVRFIEDVARRLARHIRTRP